MIMLITFPQSRKQYKHLHLSQLRQRSCSQTLRKVDLKVTHIFQRFLLRASEKKVKEVPSKSLHAAGTYPHCEELQPQTLKQLLEFL